MGFALGILRRTVALLFIFAFGRTLADEPLVGESDLVVVVRDWDATSFFGAGGAGPWYCTRAVI